MPEPASERDLLIAVNATRDLNRDLICRVGLHLAGSRCRQGAARSDLLPRGIHVAAEARKRLEAARERAAEIARRELERARVLGARLITLVDPAYPRPLLDLDLPPPVLYCLGTLPQAPAVAIVGSRRADHWGADAAELFGRELAARGLTVVSGFARGIDAAAHRGAADSSLGRTLAVLGCGLDVDYPRGRLPLRRRILARGALVSELPFATGPRGHHFPIRNRIIAALSLGVLVVQAAPRSGSLITAGLALDLGREVWALPGRIFDQRSFGTNSLIRDGASLVQHPRDILESLPGAVQNRLDTPGLTTPASACGSGASALLDALDLGERLSIEALANRSGLPSGRVLALLLELELEGTVRRHPGPAFSRPP